jgi:hypothetical protein
MKNNLVILFFLFLGCSKKSSNEDIPVEKVDNLSQMIAEGMNDHDFFLTFEDKFTENTNCILVVLPSSSCFNCFEYLTDELALFYSENSLTKIVVIKNKNVKNREIRYSLRNVIDSDGIEIFNNSDLSIITPHSFFPKLGYIKHGTLSCVEVFEQGNNFKVRSYFKFLNSMVK